MTTNVALMPAVDTPPESNRSRVDASLGMALFIGSWAMAFATMFLAFLVLRQRQEVWPPQGVALPSFAMAALATVVLLASSVTMHRAVVLGARGERGFARWWSATLALALGFAAIQSWLWVDLWGNGRLPHSGVYESTFYGLTWFHALHVAVGLIALIVGLIGIARTRYGAQHMNVPRNIGVFWHFVDVVWVVLFVTFFVF